MKPQKTIGFEINVLANLIKRHIDNAAASVYKDMADVTSMTGTNWWVMGYLYCNQEKDLFQKDLEEKFSIRRSTASKILTIMESKNLINRIPVDYDARLKKLVLTEKALILHDALRTKLKELELQVTQGLSSEELDTLFCLLDKIKKNIKE
ncbi:MarR family winged helix-turn-helix transcriptional regulator [Cellulosilyticum sp. I15G10I2]|uniref:MarR family winged helix-turn-helix transcriptional regulator n=1 Tax=Cellulosilyticum sp. I15G10I2 TaxID=1892843 RepID=UPI00085C1D14|nr:MarR family transcriptional regulator [Cellulosilyticum sp. I15G10I2]